MYSDSLKVLIVFNVPGICESQVESKDLMRDQSICT